MNEEPQPIAGDATKRDGRDGLAAVAIALLAIALIVFVGVKVI